MKRLLVLATFCCALGASAQTVLFDSMTGSTTTFTGNTPHTLMGMGFNLGVSSPAIVRAMDFAFTSTAVATYTQIQVQVSFFGVANGVTTGSNPAFGNLIASRTINTGARTTATNTSYVFGSSAAPGTPGVTFTTPFTLPTGTNLGIQILVLGDTGSGLQVTENLTHRLRHTGAFAVGSNLPSNGYYRNVSQPTPANSQTSLLGSDFRTLTNSPANTGLYFRLYGEPVPEPATILGLGLGAALLARRRRKQ
ncbi:MAG TPA: PEP-CTERM sorting domain-containing protein [Fimbriimonadaceae bacterium]|nr:PEP-CTERM sorting domain-containing protein [Fimbriimonadaceae bacterium]